MPSAAARAGESRPSDPLMTLKSILDTDILSEYLKGYHANIVRRGNRYAKDHGIFTFTSVTVFEIVSGLEFQDARSQLSKVLAWLNQNEEITPLAADYRSAATIKAIAAKQGSIVELPDCLIAAVAVRLDRPLVTGNTDDFEAIQRTGIKLTINNWRSEDHSL
jgi:predicted nucleic acid-binding protein